METEDLVSLLKIYIDKYEGIEERLKTIELLVASLHKKLDNGVKVSVSKLSPQDLGLPPKVPIIGGK